MVHTHSSTASQRVRWVIHLLAHEGTHGEISQMSRSQQVSRQTLKQLLEAMDPAWREQASGLLRIWSLAVRASSTVENWHSIVRPHLAAHRSLSAGMLALLAVWHNHRVAPRGLHQGLSPLQRSGLTKQATDWLVALGYPPVPGTQHPLVLKYQEEGVTYSGWQKD